jgi:hypothetical protein
LHCRSHQKKLGDHIVGVVPEIAPRQNTCAVSRHRFGDNHRRAALSPLQKIDAELRIWQAVLGIAQYAHQT